MNTGIIVLGSNIDPQKNIHLARRLIAERFLVLSESSFRTTKPVGSMDQPDFINGSLFIQTEWELELFRSDLKAIEFRMGRRKNPSQNYGPRTIDIDIIVWNDQVVNMDFYERGFVRDFVFEVAPTVLH